MIRQAGAVSEVLVLESQVNFLRACWCEVQQRGDAREDSLGWGRGRGVQRNGNAKVVCRGEEHAYQKCAQGTRGGIRNEQGGVRTEGLGY